MLSRLFITIYIVLNFNFVYAQDKSDLALAERHFIDGMKHFTLEEYDKAIQYFHKALKINSQSSGINYQLANAYFSDKNIPKAIEYANKALKMDKSNKYYYLLLIEIYEYESDYDKVIALYDSLINAGIENVDVYYFELATLYFVLDRYEKALSCYDSIEKIFGESEATLLQKQEIYLRLNQIDKALNQGRKLIDKYPEQGRYTINLAKILIAAGNKAEAKKILQELIEKNKEFQAEAGIILLEMDDPTDSKKMEYFKALLENDQIEVRAKAQSILEMINATSPDAAKIQYIPYLEKLTQKHPEVGEFYTLLADLQLVNNEKEKARNNYLKATQYNNSDYDLWEQLLLLDLELKAFELLKNHSEQALEYFPNQAVFWLWNGIACYMLHDNEQALESLTYGKSISFDANIEQGFLLYLGDTHHAMGDYEQSYQAYEQVLKQDPDNEHALNNYAYYLALRGEKLEKAYELALQLNRIKPDILSYQDTLAWVLFKKGKLSEAKSVLEPFIDQTQSSIIIEHYGDILFQLNEKEKAITYWEKASKLPGKSELLEKKIRDKKWYEE